MTEKITDLPSLTTAASGDLLYIVDVSDTTDSPQGSSRKIPLSSLPGVKTVNNTAPDAAGNVTVSDITPYLGVVSPHTAPANHFYAGYLACQSFVGYPATQDMDRIKLVFSNWRLDDATNLITPGDAPLKVTCGFLNPNGTYVRVTSGGSNDIIIPPGQDVETDWINVSVKKGQIYWVTPRVTSMGGAGIPMVSGGVGTGHLVYSAAPFNESAIFSNVSESAVPDLTMGGGTGGRGDGYPVALTTHYFTPTAVLAMTNRPSVFISGDSISIGQNEIEDSTHTTGLAQRLFKEYGTIKFARGGTRAAGAKATGAAHWDKGFALARYCSHVYLGFGSNDLIDGTAAATIFSDLKQIMVDWFPNKIPLFGSIIPRVSDATNVAATNTPVGFEANRQALNVLLRNSGRCIDFDQTLANGYKSPLFKSTDFLTVDGVHPSTLASNFAAANTPFTL